MKPARMTPRASRARKAKLVDWRSAIAYYRMKAAAEMMADLQQMASAARLYRPGVDYHEVEIKCDGPVLRPAIVPKP